MNFQVLYSGIQEAGTYVGNQSAVKQYPKPSLPASELEVADLCPCFSDVVAIQQMLNL